MTPRRRDCLEPKETRKKGSLMMTSDEHHYQCRQFRGVPESLGPDFCYCARQYVGESPSIRHWKDCEVCRHFEKGEPNGKRHEVEYRLFAV